MDGELASDIWLGPDVAANPLIGIHLQEVASGASVLARWTDNLGASGEAHAFKLFELAEEEARRQGAACFLRVGRDVVARY